MTAKILGPEAATTVITTDRSDPERRAWLRRQGVRVDVVSEDAGKVDLRAALATLRNSGCESVLVEGGAGVITALLAAGFVDRLIVGVAPIVIGAGTQAVEDLGVTRVADGIRLVNRSVVAVGEDLLLAYDVVPPKRMSTGQPSPTMA
jgi:riboflavin biosynthesis pyrimidine reductase